MPILIFFTFFLIIIIAYCFFKRETPQFFFTRVFRKLTFKKKRNISLDLNIGAIDRVKKLKVKNFKSISSIRKLYGIEQINILNKSFKNKFFVIKEIKKSNKIIQKLIFKSFDNVEIISFRIFDARNKKNIDDLTPVVFFSGHGSAKDLIFGKNILDFFIDVDFKTFSTYQSRAAINTCNTNNCVYVMENRGMGYMEHLGNYKEINALYQLSGSSLIGQWINDGIIFSQIIYKQHLKNITLAGISSGGLTSFIVSLFVKNIKTVICQGYLSSFQKSFLGDKSSINSVYMLSSYNFFSLAKFIKYQNIIFINGKNDHFSPKIAELEFRKMKKYNPKAKIIFLKPKELGHKFDVKLIEKFI